jgi:hypothetical protein
MLGSVRKIVGRYSGANTRAASLASCSIFEPGPAVRRTRLKMPIWPVDTNKYLSVTVEMNRSVTGE